MADGIQIRWTAPLSAIEEGCDDYGDRIHGALTDLCAEEAQRGQDAMRTGRDWTDRSGHARDSLTGSSERRGDTHVIALYTTNEDYGLVLELARAGRYAVIRPTFHAMEPIVMQRAAGLIGGSAR